MAALQAGLRSPRAVSGSRAFRFPERSGNRGQAAATREAAGSDRLLHKPALSGRPRAGVRSGLIPGSPVSNEAPQLQRCRAVGHPGVCQIAAVVGAHLTRLSF